jgi:hypothetical protein
MMKGRGLTGDLAASSGLGLAVIAIILLGLLALGYASSRFAEYALAGAITLLVLLVVLKRPEVGVYGLILTAAFIRLSLPTGTQSRIVASLVFTALVVTFWIFSIITFGKKSYFHPSLTNIPIILFITFVIFSYAWSSVFRDIQIDISSNWIIVQFGALAMMILLPGAFLYACNQLNHMRSIVFLTVIFILIGLLSILSRIIHVPFGFLQDRPLFPTWFSCITFSQALINRRLPLLVRLVLFVILVGWLYWLFLMQIQWLSAWLPTVIALGVIALCRSWKLALVFLLIVAILVGLNINALAATYQQENQNSGITRLDAYAHNWRITKDHLLFGTGPAGYVVYYMTYFPREAMATHSNYLDVLAQTGVAGLLAFLAFYWALVRTTADSLRRVVKRFDFAHAFVVSIAGGLAGSFVATGLGDWILPFVYTQTIAGFDYALYTWVLWGAGQAVNRLLRQESTVSI